MVAKLRFPVTVHSASEGGMPWNHTNCSSLTGIVEVEEGEVNGHELCISSHSISRISFAKEPHVEQVSPSSLSVVPRLFALGSGTTPSYKLQSSVLLSPALTVFIPYPPTRWMIPAVIPDPCTFQVCCFPSQISLYVCALYFFRSIQIYWTNVS